MGAGFDYPEKVLQLIRDYANAYLISKNILFLFAVIELEKQIILHK